MVLVEASLRLKEEHEDAAERVDQFIKEGDAVLNFAAGITEDNGSGGGGGGGGCSSSSRTTNGPRSGGNTNGHGDGGGGSGSGSGSGSGGGSSSSGSNRRRKKQAGYAQEDDSDSDDGEHQARIMRTRGPVTLPEDFALALLRSCVVASLSPSEGGASAAKSAGTAATAREPSRAKGWKGKGKQPASRRSRNTGEEEEEEEEEATGGVSDDQLLAVFEYWAEKREGYGGPMLRCFHPFIMKLWRRMEDPVREVGCFFFWGDAVVGGLYSTCCLCGRSHVTYS